jgi:hypothetical protein
MKFYTVSGGVIFDERERFAAYRAWAWTDTAACVETLLLMAHIPCGFSMSGPSYCGSCQNVLRVLFVVHTKAE